MLVGIHAVAVVGDRPETRERLGYLQNAVGGIVGLAMAKLYALSVLIVSEQARARREREGRASTVVSLGGIAEEDVDDGGAAAEQRAAAKRVAAELVADRPGAASGAVYRANPNPYRRRSQRQFKKYTRASGTQALVCVHRDKASDAESGLWR